MNPVDIAAQQHQWAHRHVGDKLVLCGLLLAAVVILPPWPTAALVVLIAWALAWRTGVPRTLYTAMVLGPVGFVLIGILPLLFTMTSHGVVFVAAGPAAAATVVARCLAGVSITMLFALTTPISELIAAAGRARLPEPLLFLVVAMYRMTSVLVMTAVTMAHAQQLRLGHTTAVRMLRSTAGQAANLLVQSFARARAIGQALSIRAEPGAMKLYLPTRHHDARFLARSVVCVLVVVGLGVWAWLQPGYLSWPV